MINEQDLKAARENIECIFCGSTDIEDRIVQREFRVPYYNDSNSIRLDIVSYHCRHCDSDWESEISESQLRSEIAKAKSIALVNVIDYFQIKGFSFAGMERALGLPQRTLSKWKNGSIEPSASAAALLNYIRTFPWLINIAEVNFEPVHCAKTFLSAAVDKFIQMAQYNNQLLDFHTDFKSGYSAFVQINNQYILLGDELAQTKAHQILTASPITFQAGRSI